MNIQYRSRKDLIIAGDASDTVVVEKGKLVVSMETFRDDDGVWCADAVHEGLQLSIPLSYLERIGPAKPKHGVYDAPQ